MAATAELCDLTDTLDSCEAKVAAAAKARGLHLADVSSSPVADAEIQVETGGALALLAQRLAAKLPPEIASLPGSSAALEDFLAKLRISAAQTELADSGKSALAVELTDFLGLPSDDGYKVQAVLRPAEVFSDLASKLSADESAAVAKKLGDFDDVLATFSYNPVTPSLGRSVAPLSEVLASASPGKNRREATRLATEQGHLLGMACVPKVDGDFVGKFSDIVDPACPEVGRRLLEVTEAMWVARMNATDTLRSNLDAAGYFLLADLAANQPQLVFTASRSFRDELVGAEETTVKVSYERGWVNLNGLRKGCGGTADLACLSRFLTADRRALLDKADAGNRLTFAVDYSWRQGAQPSFAGHQVDIAKRHRFSGSASLGRNLAWLPDGKVLRRVDFTGTYENFSDDADHKDRGILKLNFTQRINADFSATVGAVWATKPEFRGAVNHEVSARAGLTYSFDKDRDHSN